MFDEESCHILLCYITVLCDAHANAFSLTAVPITQCTYTDYYICSCI